MSSVSKMKKYVFSFFTCHESHDEFMLNRLQRMCLLIMAAGYNFIDANRRKLWLVIPLTHLDKLIPFVKCSKIFSRD